jgi:ABC-type glycerol-3-phosphate transport system substrate-binding protein
MAEAAFEAPPDARALALANLQQIDRALQGGGVSLRHGWWIRQRSWTKRVRAWQFPPLHGGTLRWASGAVLVLVLLLSAVLTSRLLAQGSEQWTLGVSLSDQEFVGVRDEVRKRKNTLGVPIVVESIDRQSLVSNWEERVAAARQSKAQEVWNLVSVDNDKVGLLVQKGLVRELPQQLVKALPLDPLFQELLKKHRINGRYYAVPFHPNVKVLFVNQAMLDKAGKKLPTTKEELVQFVKALYTNRQGRMAIQAHPGKAAAVTVFEWVKSMDGDPLTLADDGARQAFKLLWKVAPFLASESDHLQFDTANQDLVTDKVAVVDNWTYGIKVVMRDYEKKNIEVTPGWVVPGLQKHILGGDVLVIPTNVPHPERAIKMIELLVAKETQRALAEQLFWAPVRQDVYAELSAQPETKKYFGVIQSALQRALKAEVLRPMTPSWPLIEDVLSDALQAVLQQGRKLGSEETSEKDIEDRIDALLSKYIKRLQDIPSEFKRCDVSTKPCKGVEESTAPSIQALARINGTEPEYLALVNGRGEGAPVSPKTMQFLLVPTSEAGSEGENR